MVDSGSEMVDSTTEENFGFAFNDIAFSDRVLRLEIMEESLGPTFDNEGPNKKRRIENLDKENGEVTHSNDSRCSEYMIVKTLHINSAILAAKSPFFYKLFKNGMRESHERDVTLRINVSEEEALMDIISFMYNNTLCATSFPDLMAILLASNKFGVTSCATYSIQLLLKLLVSLESAIFVLQLPSSVFVGELLQPLIDEAKVYLATRYKDFTKFEEEAMELPLSALEVVLGSDGLQVKSEDHLFSFIFKWARAHYTKLEERREILVKHLSRFICFPNLGCLMLKGIFYSLDFDHQDVSKLVTEALLHKLEVPYGQHIHATKDGLPKRIYKFRLIKVVSFELPWPRHVVYFDLKKDECASLFPSNALFSQPFFLDGRTFFVYVKCFQKGERGFDSFGLFVKMEESSESCTLRYEFAAMNKSSKEFKSHDKGCETFGDKKTSRGKCNLFGISWTDFMSDNSEYFIDGVLHLRVELNLINSQA